MFKNLTWSEVKNNSTLIILIIATLGIITFILSSFSSLNTGRIESNFNARENFCREFHDGTLSEVTIKGYGSAPLTNTLKFCKDSNGKYYADELPAESILVTGDWFTKCRKKGGVVYKYLETSTDRRVWESSNKIYICYENKSFKINGVYKQPTDGNITVG